MVVRAERYLKIEASPGAVRIVVSLTLAPEEARRVLGAADRDSDGTVSRAEADRYLAEWGEGLETDLPVAIDGARRDVAWGEPFLDPIGPIGDAPGSVEMVARVPLDAGEHRIELVDRMRREAFDRTDVAFRAREGARLVATGPGDDPTRVVADYGFGAGPDAPAETERVTAVVEVPGAPGERGGGVGIGGIGIVVGVAVILAVGGGVLWWRRRGGRRANLP